MKTILSVALIALCFVSCKKETIISKEEIVSNQTTEVPTKNVTVDFTQIPSQNAVITFKETSGQGVYNFNSADGLLQAKQLPSKGQYIVTFTFLDGKRCAMQVIIDSNDLEIPSSEWSITTSALSDNYSMIMVCLSGMIK